MKLIILKAVGDENYRYCEWSSDYDRFNALIPFRRWVKKKKVPVGEKPALKKGYIKLLAALAKSSAGKRESKGVATATEKKKGGRSSPLFDK